jgi:uncharacterized membrane protein YphA (DoxX/SURF4 family)
VAYYNEIDTILVSRAFLAAVFGVAGCYKLASLSSFTVQLSAYRVLPARFVRAGAVGIGVLETLVAAVLVIGTNVRFAAGCALVLLVMFTFAVVLNLRRGRTDLQCGCFGIVTETIGWHLVIRNISLSGVALMLLLSSTGDRGSRPLQPDLSTFCGLIGFVLLTVSMFLLDLRSTLSFGSEGIK